MNYLYCVTVSKIPSTIQQKEVWNHFSLFGKIKNLNFSKNQNTAGETSVQVEYHEKRGFLRALRENIHVLRGFKLSVKKCLKGSQLASVETKISKRRVYVKNIPFSFTDQELYFLAEDFGAVELCYICKERRTARSKTDYGFITFYDEKSSRALLAQGTIKLKKFKTKLVFRGFNSKGKTKKTAKIPMKKLRRGENTEASSPEKRFKVELIFDKKKERCTQFHSKVLRRVHENHSISNVRFNE